MKTLTSTIVVLASLFGSMVAKAQPANFFLSTDKEFYSSTDSLQLSVSAPSTNCNGKIPPLYIAMLNYRLEPVRQFVVKPFGNGTASSLSLSGLDTGYYLLQAYASNTSDQDFSTMHLAIGINIPAATQRAGKQARLSLYPESGYALLNHTNRFAMYLQTKTGAPFDNNVLVKNNVGDVVAIAGTSSNGWCYADIPVIENDILSFYTSNGELLKTLICNNDPLVKKSGFAIMAMPGERQMLVEIRKGDKEIKQKAVLEVWYDDILLHDATATFNGDTTIVATQFPTAGLENRLIRLLLKDAEGAVATERLVIMSAVNTATDEVLLYSEIVCKTSGPANASGYSFQAAALNNQLIPFKVKDKEEDFSTGGFSLFFKNKQYAGKTIDFAILQGVENIIHAGEITADDKGNFVIRNCDFSGDAVIQFYENDRQVEPFRKFAFPPAPDLNIAFENGQITQLKGEAGRKTGTPAFEKGDELYSAGDVRELDEVAVVASRADRMKELEDKYVSNGLFRDFTAKSINVEDDDKAVYYRLGDYLTKMFPGLTNSMNYRMGYLDFYLDEQVIGWDYLRLLHMADIGYIKFYKNPVRGGMAAQRGGALLRGDSYAAGLQGSIAVYTRKHSEPKINPAKGLAVTGYIN